MIHFDQSYGFLLPGLFIMIESSGFPLPGETALIASAIYAGTPDGPNIWIVIGAAISGATLGNVIGFFLGRHFGYRLLHHYGKYIQLPESRLKIGEYLFRHYGAAAVAVARFFPLLRSGMPLLAGANRMEFRPFLVASVMGAIVWVMFYALVAFFLGWKITQLPTVDMIAAILLLVGVFGAIAIIIRRNEQQLLEKAEIEFPGDLPRS